MSSHHTRLLAEVCILFTLSSFGCDDKGEADDPVNRIGPSPITFNGFSQPAVNSTTFFSRGVTLERETVTPQLVAGAACPTRPPFQASFGIVGSGDGESDAFLREVQMRFVDRAGVSGGSMTIAQPQLLQLFGSTLIPRFGRRSFPFTFPFGCVGDPAGRLAVVVLTGGSSGQQLRTSLSLAVN
jgi:hypothetical protein